MEKRKTKKKTTFFDLRFFRVIRNAAARPTLCTYQYFYILAMVHSVIFIKEKLWDILYGAPVMIFFLDFVFIMGYGYFEIRQEMGF